MFAPHQRKLGPDALVLHWLATISIATLRLASLLTTTAAVEIETILAAVPPATTTAILLVMKVDNNLVSWHLCMSTRIDRMRGWHCC